MKLPMNSIKLFMAKTNLREVECIKYFGVILDNKLSWIQHISYMNYLCNVSKLLFTVLYADDTCVVLNGKSLNLIVETVNAELQLLSIHMV